MGQYIRFSESLLTAGGALFFWTLTLVLFFANRYSDRLHFFPLLFLCPALAFDGVLIGFQFVTIRQQCVLCIAVAVALIVLSLLYCFSRQLKVLGLCVLLIWGAGFAASAVIIMPEPQNAYSRMVLYATPTAVGKEAPSSPAKMTLVFSMQCPHCLDVVEYLSEHKTSDVLWQFAATDLDAHSIAQLDSFVQKAPSEKNPFELLYKIKKQVDLPPPSSLKPIRKKAKATRSFLSNVGLTGVPVLIVEKDSTRTIISGSPAIIQYVATSDQ